RIVGSVLDDVGDPAACFRELFAHFSRPSAWRCDKDAGGVIEQMARQAYVLGVASNYDSRLRPVVAGLPALRPVQHLVISSEVGWRKAAKPFFESLCRTARLPAHQILLVGDDLVNDYEGARAAGLEAVLVARHASGFPPGITGIGRLRELPRFVRKPVEGF